MPNNKSEKLKILSAVNGALFLFCTILEMIVFQYNVGRNGNKKTANAFFFCWLQAPHKLRHKHGRDQLLIKPIRLEREAEINLSAVFSRNFPRSSNSIFLMLSSRGYPQCVSRAHVTYFLATYLMQAWILKELKCGLFS